MGESIHTNLFYLFKRSAYLMKVTSVHLTINKNTRNNKFKGWAKIVLDDVLMISGVRFYEDLESNKDQKRFILFPDRRPSLASTGGEFISIPVVNTTNEELRRDITDSIFNMYDEILSKYGNKRED